MHDCVYGDEPLTSKHADIDNPMTATTRSHSVDSSTWSNPFHVGTPSSPMQTPMLAPSAVFEARQCYKASVPNKPGMMAYPLASQDAIQDMMHFPYPYYIPQPIMLPCMLPPGHVQPFFPVGPAPHNVGAETFVLPDPYRHMEFVDYYAPMPFLSRKGDQCGADQRTFSHVDTLIEEPQ
eukprot:SAG31_NODE_10869_length_1089_cov_0.796970_2_plen_178_part_01